MKKIIIGIVVVFLAIVTFLLFRGGENTPLGEGQKASSYSLDGYITTATVLPGIDLKGVGQVGGLDFAASNTGNQAAPTQQKPPTPKRYVYDFEGNIVHSQVASSSTFFYKQFPDGPVTYSEVFANTDRWPADIHAIYPDGEQVLLENTDNEHNAMYGPLYTSRGTWLIPSYELVDGEEGQHEALYLEEQDREGNVLWTWNSDDHFDPSTINGLEEEARVWWQNNDINDYFHFNSVTETNDGNYLITAKNMHAVVKVNRETGEVMFVFGGDNSDFTLVDDIRTGFYNSHAARELENGNILMFDNSAPAKGFNYNTRIVEYEMDYEAMTATLVWEYNTERIIGAAGSVERLPDGNTLIGWGIEFGPAPNIQVVSPEKEVLLSIALPDDTPIFSAYYSAELPLDARPAEESN